MKQVILSAFVAVVVVFGNCGDPGKMAAVQDSVPETAPHTTEKYTPVSQELYDEIRHMDSVMFDAFNAHDAEKLGATFSETLEFYHDRGGLADYKQTMDGFRKLFENTADIRRTLVEGSLEVYPLNGYGAVEIGVHRFCHTEDGKEICGNAKFTHLWQKKDGQWKVTRVISYDH